MDLIWTDFPEFVIVNFDLPLGVFLSQPKMLGRTMNSRDENTTSSLDGRWKMRTDSPARQARSQINTLLNDSLNPRLLACVSPPAIRPRTHRGHTGAPGTLPHGIQITVRACPVRSATRLTDADVKILESFAYAMSAETPRRRRYDPSQA